MQAIEQRREAGANRGVVFELSLALVAAQVEAGAGSENGWGLNIAQQGRVLFPIWYTYDATGRDTWFAMPGGTWNGSVYTGDLYTTISSGWLGTNYNPSQFVVTKVGTMSLDFSDQNNAILTYTVNNLTQRKVIVRQPF